MATISQEEENYVRLNLLIFTISPRAVRAKFDSEFDPACLDASLKTAHKILTDLKKKRIITQSQWNLLFPYNGCPDSNMFDVSLMITLLINLANFNHYNILPMVTDTTPSADLGRIKYYRNQLSHNKDGTIDNTRFSTAWGDIIEAVGRLGGKNMLDECKKLRRKILEQSTVPWNIRVQINQNLEAWKTNDSTFVETRAAKHVLTCIQENSCVTITASSGVGKTATLQHVALKMLDEGYDVLLVTNADDIVKFYKPNQKTLFVMDDFCGTYSINQVELDSLELVMERIKGLIQNKHTKIIVACRLQVYQDKKFESLSIFRTCVCNLLSKDLCLSKTEKQSIAELYLDKKSTEIIQYCDLYDCFPLLCKLYNDKPELNITEFFKNPFSVYEEEINLLDRKGCYRKYCALALCVMSNNRLPKEWFTDDIDTVKRTMIENTCEASRLDRGTSRLVLLDELKSLEDSFVKKAQGVYKTKHDKLFDFLSHYFGQNMIQCMIRNSDPLVIMQRFILEKTNDMNEFIIVVPPEYHEKYIQRMIDDWSKREVRCVFANTNMEKPEFRQIFLDYLNTLDISFQRELALTCDDYDKDTVLLQCCQYEDIPMIQWCINHDVDVNKCNRFDLSPLFVSVFTGNIKVSKLLLDAKADVDKCMDVASSLLFRFGNHERIIKTLLVYIENIDTCAVVGRSLYHFLQTQKEHIHFFLENTDDINKYFDGKLSALNLACALNHIEIVRLLLDNKADINICMKNGTSPLSVACAMNNEEIVKLLLEKKAEINICMDNGASPLYISCQQNHIKIVKILLDNKADTNKCMVKGASPLFVACETKHTEIVKVLLDNKADVNKCMDDGATPLYIACKNNHKEIVEVLLNNKADINKCMDNGAFPLFIACTMNHKEIAKVLLDNKADINKSLYGEASPLFVACQNNHKEIVEILLDNDADINKCLDNGASPLYVACQNNHIEIVNILLDNNADINNCNVDGASPLFIACHENHIEIVMVLLDNNADINKCEKNGASPFYIACQNNIEEIVKVLLDKKADINKCLDNGASPLFVACQNNHIEIVNILLDNNADINNCNVDGASPLFIACHDNHIEIVMVLLDNNADINKCEKNGASPLFIACQNNIEEIVKVLLDKKAEINKCMDNGASPLFIACLMNHIEIVKLLLDYNADINKCTDNGASPFFIACYKNHEEMVRILLDKGANYNACAKDGISPLEISRQRGHSFIVEMINEQSRKERPLSKNVKSGYSSVTPLRRSTKTLKNDQSEYSSTTSQRKSPGKPHKNDQLVDLSTATQMRSQKKTKNDQSGYSSTTPKRRFQRKSHAKYQPTLKDYLEEWT